LSLIYFISGICFAALGLPILQDACDILQGLTQWFVGFCNSHIAKYNNDISKLQTPTQEESKISAMGFQVPNESESDEIE
jgi:hypothetical protein